MERHRKRDQSDVAASFSNSIARCNVTEESIRLQSEILPVALPYISESRIWILSGLQRWLSAVTFCGNHQAERNDHRRLRETVAEEIMACVMWCIVDTDFSKPNRFCCALHVRSGSKSIFRGDSQSPPRISATFHQCDCCLWPYSPMHSLQRCDGGSWCCAVCTMHCTMHK